VLVVGLMTVGVGLMTVGVGLMTVGVGLMTVGVGLMTVGVGLMTVGVGLMVAVGIEATVVFGRKVTLAAAGDVAVNTVGRSGKAVGLAGVAVVPRLRSNVGVPLVTGTAGVVVFLGLGGTFSDVESKISCMSSTASSLACTSSLSSSMIFCFCSPSLIDLASFHRKNKSFS